MSKDNINNSQNLTEKTQKPSWHNWIWFAVGNLASVSTFAAMSFTDSLQHLNNPNSLLAYAVVTALSTSILASATKELLNEPINYSHIIRGIIGSTGGLVLQDILTHSALPPSMQNTFPLAYKLIDWAAGNAATSAVTSMFTKKS